MNVDAGDGLLALSVSELLDAVAERTPAPGGGAAAALVTALAAGLTAMAARFADGAGSAAVVERAEQLRQRVSPLADADAAAYGRYLEVSRRSPDTDPDLRRATTREALSAATDIPLRIAEVAAETAVLAASLVRNGNPNLRGDAAAAAQLAAAAATTASLLVAANVGDDASDPRLTRAREDADRAREAAAGVVPRSGRRPEEPVAHRHGKSMDRE